MNKQKNDEKYIFFFMIFEMKILQGLARTQIPTNKNNALEFPTFGEIAGVIHSLGAASP